NPELAGIVMSGHPLAGGVGGGEPRPVGRAGGVEVDPRFGVALVGVPPVEDDWAAGGGAGSVGHAKISCSFEVGTGLAGAAGGWQSPRPGSVLSGGGDLPHERERPVLERLGPDQGPVEPGLPGPGGADVVEVFTCGLDQAVGGACDLLSGL